MKLLTKAILNDFAKTGSQADVEDPKVIVKFFGGGQATWLATEYDPKTEIFYGYVSLFNDPNLNEWGSFSLDELKSIKFPPFNLGVERDMYSSGTISEYKENYKIY
jgi:hypothetical protein